jgi:hypothetical protein
VCQGAWPNARDEPHEDYWPEYRDRSVASAPYIGSLRGLGPWAPSIEVGRAGLAASAAPHVRDMPRQTPGRLTAAFWWLVATYPPSGDAKALSATLLRVCGAIGVAKGGTAPPDLDPEMLTGAPLTFPAMLRGFLYANMLANHA